MEFLIPSARSAYGKVAQRKTRKTEVDKDCNSYSPCFRVNDIVPVAPLDLVGEKRGASLKGHSGRFDDSLDGHYEFKVSMLQAFPCKTE